MNPFNENEIQKRLADLPHWEYRQDALHRVFQFPDFKQAFGFMTAIAAFAEELNHHPDWFNSYNTVEVHLQTHSPAGITELDFELARKMNAEYRAKGYQDEK